MPAELKFANEHIEPILRGEKTVTLRAELDETIQIGDRIELCDREGTRLASTIVDDRGYTTIDMAARMDWDGHANYEDTDELLDKMREYYPELDLEETSKVEIIRWDWEEMWV